MGVTIQEALRAASSLQSVSSSWRLDAQLLLSYTLGKPRAHFYTWPEEELSAVDLVAFKQRLARRQEGEPVAYIVGKREFWDFDLTVSNQVLIPRPETELLVALALDKLACMNATSLKVLDLGTGSGAIAIALAKEQLAAQVVATDKSATAIEVARGNAERLQLTNIQFVLSDWCDAFRHDRQCFDLIVSNPPYIAPGDPHLSQGDLRYEPPAALVAQRRGLADIETIIGGCYVLLKPGGVLLLEHGYNQAEAVAQRLAMSDYERITTEQDISGVDRVTYGYAP